MSAMPPMNIGRHSHCPIVMPSASVAEERVGLARELGEEAEHAVADQEQRRHLAARTRLAGEPPEQEEQREALRRAN